jgi:hypothetical protein
MESFRLKELFFALPDLDDTCVDWMMILKWIFKKWDGEAWIRSIWLIIGTGGGLL